MASRLPGQDLPWTIAVSRGTHWEAWNPRRKPGCGEESATRAARDEPVRRAGLARADLLARLRYQDGIVACSRRLLAGGPEAVRDSLEILLETSAASRAYLFENFRDPGDGLCARQVLEACAPGVSPQIGNPDLLKRSYGRDDSSLPDLLSRGEPFYGVVSSLPTGIRPTFESQGIQSFLIMPISVSGKWHGFIGLDDTRAARQWDVSTVSLLLVVADLIGAHLGSQRDAREIAERTARITSILRSSPLGHGVERDRVLQEVNDRLCAMTGYSAAELVGKSPRVLYASDQELASVELERMRQLASGGAGSIETRMRRKDGSLLDVFLTAEPIRSGDLSGGLYFSVIDITERKALEQNLEHERSLMRAVIDNLPDNIYMRDRDNRFRLANAAVARLLGAAGPDALIGKTDFDFFPRELAEKFAADDRKVLEDGLSLIDVEETVALGTEGEHWSLTTKVPVRDAEGHVSGLVGIGRDITKRRRAEQDLRRSEEQYRSLFNAIADCLLIHDGAGRLLDVNEAAVRSLGYTREELLSLSLADLEAPGERRQAAEALGPAGHSGSATYARSLLRKDGSAFPAEISAVAGTIHGQPAIIAVARDVSSRRHLEEQLAQAQKMEAVGRLAGGVAHDFNNILTVITGFGELVLAGLGEGTDLKADVQEMLRAARRAASLTEQLLAFSRKQVLKPSVVSLNRLVDELRKMLARIVGEDVRLEVRLDPRTGKVLVDPVRLEQVILNLAVNARDAMKDGGTLTLETSCRVVEGKPDPEDPPIPPGSYAVVQVTDTGQGMTREVQEHLFEPFFTTKEKGRGTGLGLATSYGIVKQSGGFIICRSRPGAGTSFSILLPHAEGPEDSRGGEGERHGQSGSETVLLVEDEQTVRTLVKRVLENNGYRVREAPDGKAALDEVQRMGGAIDILVTDVVMPGMGGRELAACARRLLPGLRILFISGYAEEAVERQGVLVSGAGFVQKPFSGPDLLEAIRVLLDGGSGAS
jgi:two-component system, cell cycle sensor histidine kinase and response regulator CckA